MALAPSRLLRPSGLLSGIARTIDQAPWKKPEDLVAKRDPDALHDRAHGQTLPVFLGAAPVEGIVFWRDGPNIETTTTTEMSQEIVYEPKLFFSQHSLMQWRDVPTDIETTTTTTTETKVSVSFAVAHSFNQFQRPGELLKVEFNDIVIYDATAGVALHSDVTMRVYDGVNNDFDPKMLAKDGAALTPAYHGLRYLFFDDIDLALFDGAIPASIRILWGDAAVDASDTIVDLHARTNAALTDTAGLSAGVTVSGFNPGQVVTLTLPLGETYTAWQPHGAGGNWVNAFRVILDGDTANVVEMGEFGNWPTAEDARAAFGTATVTGASSYTFYIYDSLISDNAGGLSIRVQAGTYVDVGTATLADELTTFSTYDDDRGGLLTSTQVTTEGLSGIVNGGVIIDTDTDLRELASRLAELFGVVKVETATGVKWVLKGKDGSYAPDVVLTEADLAPEKRGDAVVKIATRHRNPKEVPAEIEVRYLSSDADYEPMPQRAAWPQGVYDTAQSLLKRSLSVPVVLTDQQALELAWGLLARERAADRTHSIKLRSHRLAVEPSDVFELTAGGQTIVGMFTKQTKLPDHALEMTAEGYLSRAATTVRAESPIVHVKPPASFETEHVFLDGPLLLPSQDSGGNYLVGYSVITGLEGWLGGTVWVRRSDGSGWTKVGERYGHFPVVGTLTAPLPASLWPFETDTENELTFSVDYGDAAEIVAQTETQFYEATGIIAVGAPGRWTFITWRNVTDNGDGTLTLDTLRQGLRGTEVYEGTSLAGDRVVLISPDRMIEIEVPYDLADLGTEIEIKAQPLGVDRASVPAVSYTVSGTAETPYAPANLSAAINGSDIDLSWIRRTRLAAPWNDAGSATEAPLGEATELYKVEILDGPGGAVLRTFADVAVEAKTYLDADITMDFGGIPAAFTFRVSQWSAVVGWGYAGEATVPLAGGDVLGAGSGDILGAGGGDRLGAG